MNTGLPPLPEPEFVKVEQLQDQALAVTLGRKLQYPILETGYHCQDSCLTFIRLLFILAAHGPVYQATPGNSIYWH